MMRIVTIVSARFGIFHQHPSRTLQFTVMFLIFTTACFGAKHDYFSQDSVCFLQSVTLRLENFSIRWHIAFAMIPFFVLKDEMLPTISKKKYRLIVPPVTYEMSVQRSCYQIYNTN